MIKFLLLIAAIGCALVALAIETTWITSPYGLAWLAGSLALFEASFLPDRVPK